MLPSPIIAPRLDPFFSQNHALSYSMTQEAEMARMFKMNDFLADVQRQFVSSLTPETLLDMSTRFQEQFKDKLQSGNMSMLPSYNHTMPTGQEQGKYLALDVGGSTFRIALVELGGVTRGEMTMIKMQAFKINNPVRALKGYAFFDWMADRIEEVLQDPVVQRNAGATTLAMGLAWSFPVEQTSLSTGILLGMGKGFSAAIGTTGQELGELIMQSCRRKQLNVKLDAIINDGAATLLSRAYQDNRTRMALIVGTGMNSSFILPVSAIDRSKFGTRPKLWYDQAIHVLVNAELSMFGTGILPMTKWDDYINATHDLPDFQPFEYFTGGRYLSELVRLLMIEAIETCDLFGGQIPNGLHEPYTLETGVIATIEADRTSTMHSAISSLQQHHPLKNEPSLEDMQYIKQLALCVTERAARLLAMGIHALWSLSLAAEHTDPANVETIGMGCNGSVIEKYPGFRASCQAHLDTLCNGTSGTRESRVRLEVADESAIFGAAVATSCAQTALRDSIAVG